MRCNHCPVRKGLPCLGEGLGVVEDGLGPLCRDVANGLPGRAEQLVDLAEDQASSPDTGKIRVGLLCPCLNMGGAEAQQLAIARFADADKIRWVGCAVIRDDAPIDPGMRAQTAELMPVTVGPDAARRLASRCDVLIVWAIDGLPQIIAGLPNRPRVVSVVHAPPESPWGRTVYARAEGIDRWAAVSEFALVSIPASSTASTPASVIWNAVDTDRLKVTRSRAEMHDRWGVPPGARVAGYLGRITEEKDPHAMRRMVGHLPDAWHAVMVGEGNEVIVPHERLHLVGNDRMAGDCLNAIDVLIVPSHYESFGLTIAEGVWLNKPVVSTEVGIVKLAREIEVPGLTRGCGSLSMTIPVNADGPTIARAVLDVLDPEYGNGYPMRIRGMIREVILPRLAPERFGREWTDLIVSLAPPSRAELLSRVLGCPSRGSVLPISMQPEGCAKCGEKSECRDGRGEIPGRVSLRECLDCVSHT